jgi:hypothetical protein
MSNNELKAFGASNLLIEAGLRTLQEEYELDLGKRDKGRSTAPDIRMRFGLEIRRDSEIMARYYAIFYCIERETRGLVRDRLYEIHGVDWWNTKVVEGIRNEVAARMRKEIDAGIALRSTEPIDFTTFGELATIVDNNWESFTDSFVNKKATNRALSQLNLLRGPIAHNSMFVESEAQRFNLAIEDWLRQQIAQRASDSE